MIVGVAFYNSTHKVLISMPRPSRHGDIFSAFWEMNGRKDHNILNCNWTQGFVDEHGKFYDRKEAARHVHEVGQELTEYAKAEYENRPLTILFSEDVW